VTDAVVAALRRDLAALQPGDEREATSRRETLDALARYPDPFDRDAARPHVTGSAIVVGPRGVLLHRHKRLGLWLQPGGHVDPGEPPWDTAVRETWEETGIVAAHPPGGPALVHVDRHRGGRGHIHLDLRYLLSAGDVDPAPPPGESQEVAWFPWDAALATADAGLIGALRRLRPRHAAGEGSAQRAGGATMPPRPDAERP